VTEVCVAWDHAGKHGTEEQLGDCGVGGRALRDDGDALEVGEPDIVD